MRKYVYKDSRVEWLGKIPKHWKVDRIKDLCFINDSTLSNTTDEDFTIDYLDISNVNSLGVISLDDIKRISFGEAPSRARRIVLKHDTVISSVRTNLQAVAFIDFDKEHLIGSTGFFVCRPKFNKILDAKYLYYFLLTQYSKDYFFSRSVGVSYPAIDDYKFSSIKMPLPPIAEQKAIVDFLDRTIKTIDHIAQIKVGDLNSIKDKSNDHQAGLLLSYRISIIQESVLGRKQIQVKTKKAMYAE